MSTQWRFNVDKFLGGAQPLTQARRLMPTISADCALIAREGDVLSKVWPGSPHSRQKMSGPECQRPPNPDFGPAVTYLRKAPCRPPETLPALQGLFKHIDTDGSQEIDYTEFIAVALQEILGAIFRGQLCRRVAARCLEHGSVGNSC